MESKNKNHRIKKETTFYCNALFNTVYPNRHKELKCKSVSIFCWETLKQLQSWMNYSSTCSCLTCYQTPENKFLKKKMKKPRIKKGGKKFLLCASTGWNIYKTLELWMWSLRDPHTKHGFVNRKTQLRIFTVLKIITHIQGNVRIICARFSFE